MSDGHFAMFIHGNPRLMELVDDKWASDTLPHKDIPVPPEHKPPPVDVETQNDQSDFVEDAWKDLDLMGLIDDSLRNTVVPIVGQAAGNNNAV